MFVEGNSCGRGYTLLAKESILLRKYKWNNIADPDDAVVHLVHVCLKT